MNKVIFVVRQQNGEQSELFNYQNKYSYRKNIKENFCFIPTLHGGYKIKLLKREYF